MLSSLTEEDLIRKAEEMLGESPRKEKDEFPAVNSNAVAASAPPFLYSQASSSSSKRPKLDLPPVPGLEDEE